MKVLVDIGRMSISEATECVSNKIEKKYGEDKYFQSGAIAIVEIVEDIE